MKSLTHHEPAHALHWLHPIAPLVHGAIEYLTAPYWFIAPMMLHLGPTPSYLAWLLGGGIVLLSILTCYPLGLLRVVPLKVHAILDLTITPLIIVSPWLLGFAGDSNARNLFVGFGVFAFVVSLLTDYGEKEETLE